MNYTNLLVELLVIGICSMLWLIPIGQQILNKDMIHVIAINDFQTIIALPALLYFMGMIMNFISDFIFGFMDEYFAKELGGKKNIQEIRTIIFVKYEKAVDYLQQRRSIVRIYRANTLNFLVTTVILFLNVGNVISWFTCSHGYLITINFLIIVICFSAYVNSLKGYFMFISKLGKMQ